MNTFYQMEPDRYVSQKLYRDVVGEHNEQAVKEALKNDGGYYRTEQMGNDDENAADLNRIWDVEQNITSIYSSAYNPDYQTFRQKTFGLEEPFRNVMMQSVSKNPVFCRMMGVRYIVSDSDVTGYALVKKCEKTGIYQNNDAAPVMYATDRVMTEEEYKKLAFPYNQTAFLEYAVVGEHTESSDQNIMTAYEPVSLKMANNRTTGGAEQKTIQQEGQKQILFFRFRVDNAHPNKDVAVWINGIRNKLSAKDHVYYNENKIFTYAVPLKDGEDTISVTFGKGKYQLSHVQAYLGSLPERSELLYQSEIQVDKKQTEDNVIQGTICVKKDNVTPLQTNILYTQSGQDKNIYQEFKTDKRSSQSIYLKPSNYSNKNVTFYLQKKEKGVWKTITNRMIAVANDHKRVTFDTGLKKGEYRLVSNAATGQIYQIALQNQPVSNKYQTKKAKAQTIKKGKTVRNIYTTSEKAARWYKVKATKKQSIKISTNNNSGKLEVSIYKKGRKKVLKKLSFKGEQSKTYRVKKGTYYVKAAKSGAKMNGEYTIRCK